MNPRRAILPLLAAALLAGCSAYRLGTGEATARDIEVLPVRNAAPLPGVHAVLHQSLVTALAADRRLRVRSGGDRLETEVVGMERVAATRSTTDALLAGQLRITLTVRCTLRSADGKVARFADRPFSATAIVSASADLAGEERSVLPRLATEIAAQVRDAAAGSW